MKIHYILLSFLNSEINNNKTTRTTTTTANNDDDDDEFCCFVVNHQKPKKYKAQQILTKNLRLATTFEHEDEGGVDKMGRRRQHRILFCFEKRMQRNIKLKKVRRLMNGEKG